MTEEMQRGPAPDPAAAPASAVETETLSQILSELAADHAALVKTVARLDADNEKFNEFVARLKQGLPVS